MEFNVNPYYDDFESANGPRENNYMRILFKPGYAVQARELTQLQTIIQNQIKEFGNHIFHDGSPVHGGHLSLDTGIIALKLAKQYNSIDVNPSVFKDQLIVKNTGNSKKSARVIATDDSQVYPTIMVKYLTNSFDADDTIVSSIDNSIAAKLLAADFETVGSVVSINEGVFYVGGFFVYVAPQSIVLEAYSTTPTYKIGLEIDESFVNVTEDTTLADPAQQSFNYQAPGADRYKFGLNLAKRELTSTDDSKFFELLRVENGVITKQVTYPLYSDIENTLARRTYDQSGSFTVKPFTVSATANTDVTSKFDLDISSGKAYVKGYEFETIGTTRYSLDKARTKNESSDFDLSLEYGNYVAVTNVFSGSSSGIFDITEYAILDLHTVPVANINTSSALAYANTKIGTARIRNMTHGGANVYYAHLLDSNTSPAVFTPQNVISDPKNSVILPIYYSDVNSAYNNIELSVVSGTSVGDTRKIIGYTGTTKTAIVDRNFTSNLDSTSVVSLNYGVKDIDSIVVAPTTTAAAVFGGQNPANAVYPCMDIASQSRTIAGNTYFGGTNLNRLVFTLPELYVANDSFSNVDYYSRKLVTDTFNSSGILTLAEGSQLATGIESFYYGTVGQTLSSTTVETNFIVFVKDKLASPFENGQIINFTTGGASILRNSTTSMQLNAGVAASFVADIFVNVKVNVGDSATAQFRRQKTLHGDSSLLALRSTDSSLNGPTAVGSDVKVDTANGFVWYTASSAISNTPGHKQSLFVPDVFNIIKIFDSGNIAYEPNVSNAIDITNNYLFDSGQNDNYYDHASIMLKDTANPPAGQMVVMMQYFDHNDGAPRGFFNVDSYDDAVYNSNIIPVYNSKTAGTFSLRDAIDFRPTRAISTSDVFNVDGLSVPNPDLPMTLTYNFFLPRIDKLIATQNKEFKILTGIPSYVPVEPSDSEDGMTLYTIYVPPYTFDVRDIKFKYFENKRYTMRDIGRLERRIEQVEYYTSLSLLENKARSQSVLYEDAVLQKEKYGIVVDQFDGFNIADNRNSDLVCQISFNELKPYKVTNSIKLNLVGADRPYRTHDKTYSLTFTETPVISQSSATKSINVQPYLFAQFIGKAKLTPESDHWFSTKITPEVVVPPADVITPARPPVEASLTPTTGSTQTIVWSTDLNNVGYGYVPWMNFWTTGVTTWVDVSGNVVTSQQIKNSISVIDEPMTVSIDAGGGLGQ